MGHECKVIFKNADVKEKVLSNLKVQEFILENCDSTLEEIVEIPDLFYEYELCPLAHQENFKHALKDIVESMGLTYGFFGGGDGETCAYSSDTPRVFQGFDKQLNEGQEKVLERFSEMSEEENSEFDVFCTHYWGE